VKRSTLLAHERFVVYYPSLARLLGHPIRAIVMQALWFERDDDDETVMGYALLSERTGVPERTLRDHMKWLCDQGWLSQRRKSPMDATTVWQVRANRVDAAGSADSIRTPDPAGSADSIRDPADSADSIRQDPPTLDAAGSADSSYKKEEELHGGDVTYSGTEQQPQVSDEGVTMNGAVAPPAHNAGVTNPPFPWWARSHHLLVDITPEEQHRWLRAWDTITAQIGTSWDANGHLTHYLARCEELKKSPRPEEWVRWFAQDEQKAQQELRLRREQMDEAQRPGNPDWQ
jgi:hypothetical protein